MHNKQSEKKTYNVATFHTIARRFAVFGQSETVAIHFQALALLAIAHYVIHVIIIVVVVRSAARRGRWHGSHGQLLHLQYTH